MAKTVEEIARDLGVSVTTVRLIINGQAEKYRISATTQARVRAHIDQFGYVINHAARSLKRKKSETLGLIIPRLTNPFFSELVGVLEAGCRVRGYQLITVSSGNDDNQERMLCDTLLARGVDGLFVASSSAASQKSLEARRKPVVFLDRDFGARRKAPTVISDNHGGGKVLARRILEITSEPLFFLCGNTTLPTTQARIAGFAEAHTEARRVQPEDWLLAGTHNSWDEGFRLMGILHARRNAAPLPALLTASLPLLEGALHFLRTSAGGIPESLIVGTIDDHRMLDFLPNRVFSIAQDADAMAHTCLELMIAILEGASPPLPAVVLPTRLVER